MNINESNYLVIDGGVVKTEEEGIVSGLGIVFGSETEPDQSKQRDFFTADSFVRKSTEFSVPLYYNHGFGAIETEIGEAVLTKSDTGWNAVAKIDVSDAAGKKVYKAVKDTPHGFSTGALQHLVKREAKDNNTNFLRQWVVGELSLTERPAERKAVVQSVKSIDGEVVTADVAWEPTETIIFYDKDKKELWNSTEPATELDGVTPHSVEIKFSYGNTVYNFYSVDEVTGTALDVRVEESNNDQALLNKIRNILSTIETPTKSVEEDQDFESRVTAIVAKMKEEWLAEFSAKSDEPSSDVTEVTEDEELADLRGKLTDRENALTKANQEIARLEILAGAKETINKNKGK